MRNRVREWTAHIAVALLVSLPALWAPHSFDPHHDAENALLLVVAHDESAHHFDTAPGDGTSDPLHCVVCHLARLLRPRLEGQSFQAPAVQVAPTIALEWLSPLSAAPVAQPSLRSPPDSPISA
jgi:hypothetical protein